MLKIEKDGNNVILKIDSSCFRECDLIMSDIFNIDNGFLLIYSDNGVVLDRVKLDDDFVECLTDLGFLKCYIKLKNGLTYGIERVLKKT